MTNPPSCFIPQPPPTLTKLNNTQESATWSVVSKVNIYIYIYIYNFIMSIVVGLVFGMQAYLNVTLERGSMSFVTGLRMSQQLGSSSPELSFHRPIPHSSCNSMDPATNLFVAVHRLQCCCGHHKAGAQYHKLLRQCSCHKVAAVQG